MDKVALKDEPVEIISLKSNQGINECNLMILPFISFQKTKVKVLERYWESNGIRRSIKVVGSAEHGCPTVLELDVLLGLFRILLKNIGYKYSLNKETNTVVGLPQKINFTYQELSKELGYKYYGGTVKKQLEKSIKILVETTIYSTLGVKNIEKGGYVSDFNGENSARILKNYVDYSYTKRKIANEKINNPVVIKEMQSVEIDDFFFKNMCNNFFKIYDYKKYIKLGKGLSKKLYLLLSQWSHGYEKTLNYSTLYDYLSIDVKTEKKRYYYNRLIKDALVELKQAKFIDDFKINTGINVSIVFSTQRKKRARKLNKYKTEEEIIIGLQTYGLTFEEWSIHYRLDNQDYVRALLRYVEDRVMRGLVPKPKEYLLKGLVFESYDVSEFYD